MLGLKTFGNSGTLAWATVAGIFGVAATAGCQLERVDDGIVSLRPAATAKAPISMSVDIALVSEDVACVINSFDPRLYCVDSRRQVVGTFGREGEGPGELRPPAYIERGPEGSVAVFELGSAQMTFFRPDGALLSETRMPADFVGTDLWGDRVLGFRLAMLDRSRSNDQSRYAAAEVDASSGEVLWERDVADAVGLDCFNGLVGTLNPNGGGIVTTACEQELVFLDHWADSAAIVVPSPTYVPALPNERDVEVYVERVSRIGGGMVHLSDARKEAYAAGYRDTPKKWYYGGSVALSFDGENRLWAATSRDRDAFSYFDIWMNRGYAGTVRIRDRLMGYDILGSTLVALVEREPDRYGIAPRAIDWYDIGNVAFTRDK